jgi:hypothetical protein
MTASAVDGKEGVSGSSPEEGSLERTRDPDNKDYGGRAIEARLGFDANRAAQERDEGLVDRVIGRMVGRWSSQARLVVRRVGMRGPNQGETHHGCGADR